MNPDHLHHWPAIAGHLGIKPDAARHLERTADLPVFRIGKTVCASRSRLDAWLSDQAAKAVLAKREAEANGGAQ